MTKQFKNMVMTLLIGLVLFFTHIGQVQECFSRLHTTAQEPMREDVADIFQKVLDEAGNNAAMSFRVKRIREAERHIFSDAPPMAAPPAETMERFIRANTRTRYPPPESHFNRGPPSTEQFD